MRKLGALAVICGLLAGASAYAAQDDITMAYHLTHKCPAGGSGPGSAPGDPIALEDFDEAWSAAVDAVENAADDEAKGNKDAGFSRFECRWIKLSGYFRWSDYYSYRGPLYRSAHGYYFDRQTSYLIENFADPATRRSELQARQVELVGRFYNLCMYAPNADMVFGPCHYGGYKGMMLSDVRILSVGKDEPRILTGEANRELAESLRAVPADWKDLADVEESARYWLKLLQSGRRAYEQAIAKDLDAMKPEERREYFDPDGWVGTLLDPKRSNLAGKDIARLPMKVFYEPLETTPRAPEIWATACVCLKGTCEDRWPLITYDAQRLNSEFICLDLEKDVLGRGGAKWDWRR